jgi:hypothetical protein
LASVMSWMAFQIACPGDLHDDPAPPPSRFGQQ